MKTKEEILDYLETKETYGALLLTGSWGCGKSFLLRSIKENNKDKYSIAIVSLFGITSASELYQRVKEEYISFYFDKVGNAIQKGAKRTSETKSLYNLVEKIPFFKERKWLPVGLNSLKTVLSINPLDFIPVSNSVNKKTFVLVFDDFERCKINIIDLLGVINEFCENKKIKTIIVADEKKIEDKQYGEFKEKTIIRTIKFDSICEEIIRSIVINYNTENCCYKQFLNDNIDTLVRAFNDSQYHNYRTIRYVIYCFERVYVTWITFGEGIIDLQSTLYKFYAIASEYKAGKYIYIKKYGLYLINVHLSDSELTDNDKENQSRQDKKNQEIKGKYKDNTFSDFFYSLSRWIVTGEWKERQFIEELEKRYVNQTEELSSVDIFLKSSFWSLNSNIIKDALPIVTEKAYTGQLTFDELIKFLQTVFMLKSIDESLIKDIDYEKIEKGLDKRIQKIRSGEVNEPQRHTLAENHTIDSRAISINQKIENLYSKLPAWKGYDKFIDFLNDESENWYSYTYINCIDVFDNKLRSLFLNRFVNCSNEEKRILSRFLLELPLDNRYYSTPYDISISIKNLKIISKRISDLITDGEDLITLYLLKTLKTQLDQKILTIETNNTEHSID